MSIATHLTSVLSLMKIFLGPISRGFRLSAAFATVAVVAALPASAQDPPPAIVQPGAPGQPTRTLTIEEAAALRRPVHVDADVRLIKGMIHHHGQALDMTELLSSRTESEEMRLLAQRIDISQTDEIGTMARWLESRGEDAPKVREEEAYLDQLMKSDAIRADRAVSTAGALNQLERLGRGPEQVEVQAQVLAQLEQTAFDLERDSRVSVAGERPTDRSRMRSLAATLRGLAGSVR